MDCFINSRQISWKVSASIQRIVDAQIWKLAIFTSYTLQQMEVLGNLDSFSLLGHSITKITVYKKGQVQSH